MDAFWPKTCFPPCPRLAGGGREAVRRGKQQRPDPFAGQQPSGYHYSRRERLEAASAPRYPARGGGIFRGNRTLLIILLDLIIVLILGLLLMRFLYARVNKAELEGYSVELRAVRLEQVVLATLTVTNRRAESAAEQTLYARFSLKRNPGEEESTYASWPAPREAGKQRVFRTTIPFFEPSRVLYAELQIGDSTERVSVGLESRSGI